MFGQGFNSPQLHQRFEPRLKATQKQGVRHKCHSLFLWLAPCLALRSVPLMGTEIVTRLCLAISISRHPLSAIAIPSRTLSAPYNSPQLHQRFEQTLARLDTIASRRTLSALAIPSSLRSSLRLKAIQKTGSTAQVPLPFSLARPLPRSPLRSADGHRNRDAIVPRYLHISASPIGNRYSVADSVRSLQLPSAPPTLRADARAARYDSISPYPIGARYSVLASLVLTAQSDPKNREYGTSATPFFFGSPPASLSAPFR